MTSVLFLDVDGVLNHRAIFQPSRSGSPLCPAAIRRLRGVVSATGCRVVLSSTWRMLPHHVEHLRAAGGFPSAHEDWRTVEVPVEVRNGIVVTIHQRGYEIAEWLSRHPEVERYAIVDDDSDMLPTQLPFFVQTSFDTGLLDEHAARLVDLLGFRTVAVCGTCRTVACRRGFRCDSPTAEPIHVPLDDLAVLDLEHPDYWEEQA